MKPMPRRSFLKGTTAAGLALGVPRFMMGDEPGPNEAVRVGIIGLGATDAVGGVGGRGHQLIGRLREISGARIVALCDADQKHLDRELKAVPEKEGKVAAYTDMRRLLDDKNIDAVVIALPNHW